MSFWMDFGVWKERHCELVREAERGRRVRELREAHRAREVRETRSAGGRLWEFIAVVGPFFFSRAYRG